MNNTILVVEDEKNLCRLYQIELEAEGYQVITAANGREALDCLKQETVDLIVLDLVLPDISGLDCLQAFMNYNRDLKVVINSAYPNYKYDFQVWAADAFVTKSSDLSELKETVNRLLQSNFEQTFD
jgi:DNA-binding NtrC family response regulator